MSAEQYRNTVHDLFPDLEKADENSWNFPTELIIDAFVNQADGAEAHPTLVEAYVQHASEIATQIAEYGPPDNCSNAACQENYILETTNKAWRRPLSEGERDELLRSYREWRANYNGFTATKLSLQSVLLAPDFLYFPEFGDPTQAKADGSIPLTSHEVATRLSYLFWNTLPDDELRKRANRDELQSREAVLDEARRLMAHKRFKQGLRDFNSQWLDLPKIANTELDIEQFFPSFGDDRENAGLMLKTRIQPAMREEIQWFNIHHIAYQRASLYELLTTTDSFANPVLARRYGVDWRDNANTYSSTVYDEGFPNDSELYPVQHDPDKRAGLLTLAGIQHAHSKPTHASPIERGLFVKERFLCQPIVPPPMDVPPLDAAQEKEPKTNRERYEVHTTEPACQACHQTIDPLGFPFEHYDALGMYQKRDNGYNIDASSTLVGTDVDGKVHDAIDLTLRLADSRDVHDCYAEHWRRYAFGRSAVLEDRPFIEDLNKAFWQSGGDIQELLINLAASHSFRHRAAHNTDDGGAQ